MQSGNVTIELRVGAPAEMLRAIQHLLHAHLEDHVRMRADPDTARGNVAQQRVEHMPVAAIHDGIDPDQDRKSVV